MGEERETRRVLETEKADAELMERLRGCREKHDVIGLFQMRDVCVGERDVVWI